MTSLPIGMYPDGKFCIFKCESSQKEYAIIWAFETEITHKDIAGIHYVGKRILVSAGFWQKRSGNLPKVLGYTSETLHHDFPPREEDNLLIAHALGMIDHPTESTPDG